MKKRLRDSAWSVLFLGGGYAIALALLRVLPIRIRSGGVLSIALVQAAALLFGYGILTWLIGGKVLGLSPRDFGFGRQEHGIHRFHRFPGIRGFGWGLLVGIALAGVAMLLAVPLGHAAWRNDGASPLQWIGTLALTGGVMLSAAFAEELAFRGVPLLALARSLGRAPALVVGAALFGVAHLDNPNVTALAVINIVLAGIFLGLAFFTPGGLWTSTGAHLGWNLTLAGLAAPVSGIALPMPWLDYSTGGPRWLTGGGFGPEGGLLATGCLLGGAVLALRRIRPERAT